jgi:hypothetical protein
VQQNFNEYFSSDIFPSKNIEGIKNWEKKLFNLFFFLSATFNPEERKPKKFPAFRIKTKRQKKKESENNSDFLKREECLQLC